MISPHINFANADEFQKTMAEYLKHSSRSMVEALNEKAFFIAKQATFSTNTKQASKSKIQAYWRRDRRKAIRYVSITLGADRSTPREEITREIQRRNAAAVKSMAFLRAGWLAPMVHLAEGGFVNRSVVSRGQSRWSSLKADGAGGWRKHGYAKPATLAQGFAPSCQIANGVGDRSDLDRRAFAGTRLHAWAAAHFGQVGLAKAVALELASMKAYIERKLAAAATAARATP